MLSGSTVVSIFRGMGWAKVLAVVLQPAGYGYYGLLQSFVGLTTLFAGLGMATGLVRLGAGAATSSDEVALASLRRGAWLLFGGLGSLALVLLFFFRMALSRWALGSPAHGKTILLLGIALLFTVAGNIQIGTLNAYHRVGALARYGVVNTLLGALITLGGIVIWRTRGIVPPVLGGAVASWGNCRLFLHLEPLPPRLGHPPP